MANVEFKLPCYVTLTNKTDKDIRFIPYKENFATTIEAGEGICLAVETAGAVFYYLNQAKAGLTVETAETAGAATEKLLVVDVPATITITNESKKDIFFVPYRENFSQIVNPGQVYSFPAKTAGQVIYYLNQATEELTVDQAKQA